MPHGYRIVPDLAIAARGPVRSVKLFSRVPFREIRRLALDEGSRTSQALCRVWLDERHGVRPEAIEHLPMGVPAEESTADAVLLIGDRAMRDPAGPFVEKVDMARAWQEMTGLPFVFAVWAVRPGIDLGDRPPPCKLAAAMACRMPTRSPASMAPAGPGLRRVLRLPDPSPVLRPGRP
ncbi:MAG: MqnA/MqnD/SBP family protein [Isosphaeraceae bacterium]